MTYLLYQIYLYYLIYIDLAPMVPRCTSIWPWFQYCNVNEIECMNNDCENMSISYPVFLIVVSYHLRRKDTSSYTPIFPSSVLCAICLHLLRSVVENNRRGGTPKTTNCAKCMSTTECVWLATYCLNVVWHFCICLMTHILTSYRRSLKRHP